MNTTRTPATPRRLSSALCLLALSLLAPAALHAQSAYWNAASGTWNTPNGWFTDATFTTPRNAPAAADSARITGGNVTLASSATTTTGIIGDTASTSGTVTIASGGFWQNSGTFLVGDSGAGTLNILTGGSVSSNSTSLHLTAGNAAGGYGVINVEDGGYLYTGAQIRLGNAASGTGILNIESGATVRAATGVYASLTNGYGVVNIATGGTLIIDANALYVGNGGAANANSYGEVNIDGYFQSGGNGTYYTPVGYAGIGVLNIGVTGTVFSGQLDIGREATASGTVNVAGYYKNNSTSASGVGSLGNGTLNVASTGYMNMNNCGLYIGNGTTGSGIVTISGTVVNVNTFYVNNNSVNPSSFNITQDGYLSVINNSWFNRNLPGTGKVNGLSTANIDGLWYTGGYFYVANEGTSVMNIGPTGGVYVVATATDGIRIGGNANSSGTAFVSGLMQSGGYVGVGYNRATVAGTQPAVGYLYIAQSGTVMSTAPSTFETGVLGWFGFGSGATITSATGIAVVDGVWLNNGHFEVGRSGDGILFLNATGTITNNNAWLGRYYSTGVATGTAFVSGVWLSSGNMYIGDAGWGDVTLTASGTIITAGATIMANGVNSRGAASAAGYWSIGGDFTVGNQGPARLNLAPTSALTVGGNYRQSAKSTLSVEIDLNRPQDTINPGLLTPLISARGAATLSGTLIVNLSPAAAASINFVSDGNDKASELSGIPILRASGGISGDFTTVKINGIIIPDPNGPNALPDYISGGGLRVNEGGPVDTRYDVGFGLAWKGGVEDAHGTFTVKANTTFDVDVQLADRPGIAFTSGWDGKSLTKKGPGTLILSVENSFTGATIVDEGTLRFTGPARHNLGPLTNNALIDFYATGPTGNRIGGYRTISAASLDGSGAFHMGVDLTSGASDHLIINGDATGSHRLLISGVGALPTGDEPTITLVTIGGVNDTTFTASGEITDPNGVTKPFTGNFDYGTFNYEVQTLGNRVVIMNTGLAPAVFDPIRGVPGAQSLLWFDQQDTLSHRLGELRSPTTSNNPQSEIPNPKSQGWDLWLRGHASRATLGGGATQMRQSSVDIQGAELGADHTWASDTQRATLGLHASAASAKQHFDLVPNASSASGKSDLLGGGLYAAWLTDTGWFLNATLSLLQYKNHFDAADLSYNHTTGNYKNRAFGATAEAGRRFTLGAAAPTVNRKLETVNSAAAWFIEPAIQAALARITRDNYSTSSTNPDATPLSVHGSDASITRLRGALRFGRAWNSPALGWLEIAARAGAVRESSTGGEVIIGSATRWRPNLDGTRYEAGLALNWRPKADFGQFYLDYEYATGDNFRKPWGLSLGFRLSL